MTEPGSLLDHAALSFHSTRCQPADMCSSWIVGDPPMTAAREECIGRRGCDLDAAKLQTGALWSTRPVAVN